MKWTMHLEGGPRRVNHAAVALGEKIFSFGGYCSGEDYEQRRPMDVHLLDIHTYRWKSLPLPSTHDEQYYRTPYQRYGHTVVEYRNKAYLWGGRNDGEGACDLFYEFDPNDLRWRSVTTTGQVPPARDGHSACVVGHQMIIFGGFEEEFQRFSNETYLLDFRNLKWIELQTTGRPPMWRDFHTSTTVGSKMYVFGGRSDQLGQFHSNKEVYDDQLKYLDLLDNHWYMPEIRSGDKPCGRRSHSSWSYNGNVFVFGGYNGRDNRHFNDLYRFDPVEVKWYELRPTGNGPKPRRRQCCVPKENKVFLFGGTSPVAESSTFVQEDPSWSERNLIDHSDMYVLDLAPTLKTLAICAAVNSNLHHSSDLPVDVRWDIAAMTTPNRISAPRAEMSG